MPLPPAQPNPGASATTRRQFLRSGLALSGGLFAGCQSRPSSTGRSSPTPPKSRQPDASTPSAPLRDDGHPWDASTGEDCTDGGPREYVDDVPFVGEDDAPFEVAINEGLDGRLFTDLTRLTSRNLIVANDAFYIRTRRPDRLTSLSPWTIRVHGTVQRELTLNVEQLRARERALGTHLLECSGNGRGAGFGMLSSAEWGGIEVLDALSDASATSPEARILISGFDDHSLPSANNHSTPGASWIFTRTQLESAGAFFATSMNGEALPPDHGAPIRLVVPGWYGCTCIKWVDEIEFVPDDAAATSQMLEFASRTHQSGTPELARDYLPAVIDTAAMPIRVERWRNNAGSIVYRVVGIVWGGTEPVSELEIRFGDGTWSRVPLCTAPSQTTSWSLWSHWWQPSASGTYSIVLRVGDPNVRTRRLDRQYYLREVTVDV